MTLKLLYIFSLFILTSSLSIGGVKKYISNLFTPPQTKIVGGFDAIEGQFPYQVLLKGFKGSHQFICGGSVITNSHILTAAHCVDFQNGVILFGSTKTWYLEGLTRTVTTNDVIIHPRYDPIKVTNDIAIIILPEPVQFNIDNNGAINLQYAKVSIFPQYRCRLYYQFMYYWITDKQICTKYENAGTCNGDSGGPLVVSENDGILTQIGIVSFGTSMCEDGSPGVYTFVPSYISWIKSVIN